MTIGGYEFKFSLITFNTVRVFTGQATWGTVKFRKKIFSIKWSKKIIQMET